MKSLELFKLQNTNLKVKIYRQELTVTEEGYLLSSEKVEVIGNMLGGFKDKEIPSCCEANGQIVASSQDLINLCQRNSVIAQLSSPQLPRTQVVGRFE